MILETGGIAGMLDQKFIQADGSVIDVSAQVTRISYRGEPAIMIIAQDIGERKKQKRHVIDFLRRLRCCE